jgi:membrane AbrB-like protein
LGAMSAVIALALAAVGGYVADRLHIPGGLILGSMLGAAAPGLIRDLPVQIPTALGSSAQIVIGAVIGVGLTRSGLVDLGWLIVPAVISGVLIIGAGVGIALLLRVLHMAPDGDVLATSPGALNVLSGVAVQQGYNAVHVAYFHLVRIVMVILSLPLLTQLVRARP